MTQRISPLRMTEEWVKEERISPLKVACLPFNPLAEPWKTNENKKARPLDMCLDLAKGGAG